MSFQKLVNQADKDRLFWSASVDLIADTLIPTSKGGTCLEFFNLLATVGSYSKFLEVYGETMVAAPYRAEFQETLNPQHMLAALQDGGFCSISYAMKSTHGNQRTMMLTAFSADGDPTSGKCVITATSIDNEYNMMLELEGKSKQVEEEARSKALNVMLKSLADVFYAVTLVDLEQNSYQEIISGNGIHPIVQDEADPQKALDTCINVLVSSPDQHRMRDFLNLKTLPARLSDQRSITATFFSLDEDMAQLTFLPVSRDENGVVGEVLIIVQFADDMTKSALRYQADLKNSLDDALRLAGTDGMTQLLNRTGGERYIRQYLSRGGSGMFCLLDVDDFKHFNDVYGHDAGDKVLQCVGACIAATFRSFDVLMRAGGDEFAIFALGLTDRSRGLEKQQELKERVAEVKVEGIPETISISTGTAYSDESARQSFEALYKEADECMYQEKAAKKASRR